MATLEELEIRLAALEREVAALRGRGHSPAGLATPEIPGKSDQAVISDLVARLLPRMGVTAGPIGAEKVQALVAACGVRAEDNLFSRGIREMREE